jgi:uncharacterized protein (TIGR02301 family)
VKKSALAVKDRAAHIGAHMLKRSIAACCLVLLLGGPPAHAIEGGPAPFDNDLARLAEILGALHYLRGICNSKDGERWREQMQALVEAEAPSGERKQKMVASFNRGYRGFQQTYRSCTPAADIAIRRYLEEGARIARDITARYAN